MGRAPSSTRAGRSHTAPAETESSFDSRDTVAGPWEPDEYAAVVTRHDESWLGRKSRHPFLGAGIRGGVEGLGDGSVPLEILVQVGIIAGQHDRARAAAGEARVDGRKLRREGVLSAGEHRNAGDNLRLVAGNQLDVAGDL